MGFWQKPKRLAGYELRSVVEKDVVFEACTCDYGFMIALTSSQKDLLATQEAFNVWRDQSGRSAREISRLLALSTG